MKRFRVTYEIEAEEYVAHATDVQHDNYFLLERGIRRYCGPAGAENVTVEEISPSIQTYQEKYES